MARYGKICQDDEQDFDQDNDGDEQEMQVKKLEYGNAADDDAADDDGDDDDNHDDNDDNLTSHVATCFFNVHRLFY